MHTEHLTDRTHQVESAEEDAMRLGYTSDNFFWYHEGSAAVASECLHSTIHEERFAIVPSIAHEVQEHIFMIAFEERHGTDRVSPHSQQQVHHFASARSAVHIIAEEHELIFRLK